MEIYTLQFDWPAGVTPERPGPHNIPAESNAHAMAAAMKLFKGQQFANRPRGYRLLNQAGMPVDNFIDIR